MRPCSLEAHAAELAGIFQHPSPVRFLREADDVYLSAALTGMVEHAMQAQEAVDVQVFDPATGISTLAGVEVVRGVRQLSAYLELKRAESNRPPFTQRLWWIRGCAALVLEQDSRSAIRALGNLLRTRHGGRGRIRILVSGADEIPVDLAPVAASMDLSRPRRTALLHFLDQVLGEASSLRNHRTDIARALQGLDASSIVRILEEADAEASVDPVQVVRDLRDRHIGRSGVVEVLASKRRFEDVGGLEHLKQWLKERAFVFEHLEHARLAKVDPPRGVLLAGLPGCGKSLVAEVTSACFGIPLLRLDVGRLMGKYLGESERNLREALAIAEAASPCVMWIDEIEKGLSGAASDEGGGTSSRVFGHLLTWMQEGRREVFIVATANDVDRLPPELLRRGRFDEMFLLDLPTAAERGQILEGSMERRGQGSDAKLMSWLKNDKVTKSYSGADLDALVAAAIEEAWRRRGAPLARVHFETVIRGGFVSHATQWGARSALMRAKLAKHGFRPASVSRKAPLRLKPQPALGDQLPASLRKFTAPMPVVVHWKMQAAPLTIHFQSEGSQRIARLGTGSSASVFEDAAIATYSVVRKGNAVHLGRRSSRGSARPSADQVRLRPTGIDFVVNANGDAEIECTGVGRTRVRASFEVAKLLTLSPRSRTASAARTTKC